MDRVERLGGEKYHLNRLSVEELNGIRAHTIARVSEALHDVEVIEVELALRRPEAETGLADAGFTASGEYVQIERTPTAQADFAARRVDL